MTGRAFLQVVGIISFSTLSLPVHSMASTQVRPEISISDAGLNRFELVYSGSQFKGRDGPERELLVSAARLALAHQQPIFSLLALPGEEGDVHPARRNSSFGAEYGHWQPHWTITGRSFGVQWWHPEWGRDFWTSDIGPNKVDRFQVHAMIQLRADELALKRGLQFDAGAIVRDLAGPSSVKVQHEAR